MRKHSSVWQASSSSRLQLFSKRPSSFLSLPSVRTPCYRYNNNECLQIFPLSYSRNWHRRSFCHDRSIRADENPTTSARSSSQEPNTHELGRIQHQRMQLTFTCAECDTRATKFFGKKSYQKGIVIVRCDGCQHLHLVADNLGWFGTERNIEEILAKKGQNVHRGTTGEQFELDGTIASFTSDSITFTPKTEV